MKFTKESYDKISVRFNTADNTYGFASPLWIEISRAGSGEIQAGIRAGLSGPRGLSS
jgi:hypothetical protein